MKSSVQVILFAAAALVGCLATAINAASPQEILLPFNDLLPPLLEEPIVSTHTAGAETEAEAAAEVAVAKPEAIIATEQVAEPLAAVTTVVEGVEASSHKATIALPAAARVAVKATIKQTKPEKKPLKKSYYQQQQQQQLKQYEQHQNTGERTTGRRPPKGVLPTLTPFPRHLKKILPSN